MSRSQNPKPAANLIKSPRPTVSDYPLNDFLLWLLGRNYSPATARIYVSGLRRLFREADGIPQTTDALVAAMDRVSFGVRSTATSAWRDFRAFSRDRTLPDLPYATTLASRRRHGWLQEGSPKERKMAALYHLVVVTRTCTLRTLHAAPCWGIIFDRTHSEIRIPAFRVGLASEVEATAPVIVHATADTMLAFEVLLGYSLDASAPTEYHRVVPHYIFPQQMDASKPASYTSLRSALVTLRAELENDMDPSRASIATKAARSLLEELRSLVGVKYVSTAPRGPASGSRVNEGHSAGGSTTVLDDPGWSCPEESEDSPLEPSAP